MNKRGVSELNYFVHVYNITGKYVGSAYSHFVFFAHVMSWHFDYLANNVSVFIIKCLTLFF